MLAKTQSHSGGRQGTEPIISKTTFSLQMLPRYRSLYVTSKSIFASQLSELLCTSETTLDPIANVKLVSTGRGILR
jgi:hypothetical protein